MGANAVTAAKIKDNEVKAAETATDAVGAAEIQGVTKLLFGQCTLSTSDADQMLSTGFTYTKGCSISGVDSDDTALAELNRPVSCIRVSSVLPSTNVVGVALTNVYSTPQEIGAATMAVIVYDK